jgi:UDP-glucose 4-epimerase
MSLIVIGESGVLGEDPRSTPNNLMPVLLEAMTGQRSKLDIFSLAWDIIDGTAVRDFIYASDLAGG